MSGNRITIIVRPTFRDLAGRFTKANEGLLASKRDILRQQGKRLVQMAREELDDKTDGRSGKLASAIRYNTRIVNDNEVRLSVTAPGRAGPHRIYPRNAGALAFSWGKVGAFVLVPRSGGFRTHYGKDGVLWVGKGYVDHPGGTLVPLFSGVMERTLDRWSVGGGQEILQQIASRWVSQVGSA